MAKTLYATKTVPKSVKTCLAGSDSWIEISDTQDKFQKGLYDKSDKSLDIALKLAQHVLEPLTTLQNINIVNAILGWKCIPLYMLYGQSCNFTLKHLVVTDTLM